MTGSDEDEVETPEAVVENVTAVEPLPVLTGQVPVDLAHWGSQMSRKIQKPRPGQQASKADRERMKKGVPDEGE